MHWENSDEILKRIKLRMPEYIRKLGEFNYKNESCRLINHYKSDSLKHCAIENHPIKEVYVVETSTGATYNIGNVCIDRLGHEKITKWFRNQQREENKFTNTLTKKRIDILSDLLNATESGTIPFNISESRIANLKQAYYRAIKDKRPLKEQQATLNYVIARIAKEHPSWNPNANKE